MRRPRARRICVSSDSFLHDSISPQDAPLNHLPENTDLVLGPFPYRSQVQDSYRHTDPDLPLPRNSAVS